MRENNTKVSVGTDDKGCMKADKVNSKMDLRTLATEGTAYILSSLFFTSIYTLWDSNTHSVSPTAYLQRTLRFPLVAIVLILSSFIPAPTESLLIASINTSESLQMPNYERLADAVYLAEGGAKAKVPYGIFYPGCSKSSPAYCRKIAINTFKSAYKRFKSSSNSQTYISYLASTYAPMGVKNDPSNLNRHWIRNVNHFIDHLDSR